MSMRLANAGKEAIKTKTKRLRTDPWLSGIIDIPPTVGATASR